MAVRNEDRLILVTGATGQQGGATLRRLRQKGFAIRALTRNPDSTKAKQLAGQGVEVVKGDQKNEEELRRALDGVHGVFGVQTFFEEGVESEVEQGKRLVDLAQRAGVSHFVYTSVGSAHRNTGIPHFESKWKIEEHLRQSGLPHTILRPVYFFENWNWLRAQIEQGVLPQPLSPDRKLAQIAVDDIGFFAAEAFEHRDKWLGRAIELAGDDLSMKQVAEGFSRVLAKPVQYVQVPWDEFEKQMGEELTIMYRWFEEIGYTIDLAELRSIHPDLMTFDRWLNLQGWDYQPS
jgi:uncharacterized protein YbjT (DUF2867 family)